MMYLKELGFDDNYIQMLNDNLPERALDKLNKEKENVIANINYLKELPISNYQEAFAKFYNMFLLDTAVFDEIFSKYDKEDLIIKLEQNIAIMEYL